MKQKNDEVNARIQALRNGKKDQELAIYLVSLIGGDNHLNTIDLLYNYVLDTKLKGSEEFWINADVINNIADLLSEKITFRDQCARFYELTGKKRQSELGAAKYISCRLSIQPNNKIEEVIRSMLLRLRQKIDTKKYSDQAKLESFIKENTGLEAYHKELLFDFKAGALLKWNLPETELAFQINIINSFIIIFSKEDLEIENTELGITAKSIYQSSLLLPSDKSTLYPHVVRLMATLLKWQANIILLEERILIPGEKKEFKLPSGEILSVNFDSSWSRIEDTNGSLSMNDVSLLTKLYNIDKAEVEIKLHTLRKQMKEVKKQKDQRKNDINEPDTSYFKKLDSEYKALLITEGELETLLREVEDHFRDYTPLGRATLRRHATECAFFNPRRNKKKVELQQLTHTIIDQRFRSKNSEQDSIDLTDYSTRLTITAERLFQEAVGILAGDKLPILGIPIAREQSHNFGNGSNKYGPHESYLVGETTVVAEHRSNPKPHRRGDSFMVNGGTYNGKIYPLLQKLTGDDIEQEKEIALLMLRYGRTHQVATLDELNAIKNGIKVMSEEFSEEALEEVINAKKSPPDQDPLQTSDDEAHEWQEITELQMHEFNSICFLIMEKEQMQWHSATDKKYHAGMIVAQTRCLMMLAAGYLQFGEVFQNNVLFGIYSKTELYNNFKEVKTACDRVEKLYSDFLLSQDIKFFMAFRKKFIDVESALVSTRSKMHEDLIAAHGGESDTESENEDHAYDSDIDMGSLSI